MHNAQEDVELNALLSETWSDLRAAADTDKKAADGDVQVQTVRLKELETELRDRLNELPGVRKQQKTVADAMTEASRTGARHAATQDLLRGALVALADDDPASFGKLREILHNEQPFKRFTVVDGVVSFTEEKDEVEDLVDIEIGQLPSAPPASAKDLATWGEAIAKFAKLDKHATFQLRDPGIATTVIGLGLDVALAEERRMLTEIAIAKEELKLRTDLIELYKSQSKALEENIGKIDFLAEHQFIQGDVVLHASLERFGAMYREAHAQLMKNPDDDKKAEKTEDLRQRLTDAFLAVAANYHNRVIAQRAIAILKDRIAHTAADRELAIAAANLAEREAVIGRGLEGLVAFHQGGINQDDVGNVIGIAQAAGLLVLGGL